ncbi:hypothetical protein WDU94_002855 [Cyamophila willieti]
MAFLNQFFHRLVAFTKTLPVLLCIATFTFSYGSYLFKVYKTNSFLLDHTFLKFIQLCVFHLLFFMYLWSFVQLVLTSSTKIPDRFRLSKETRDTLERVGYNPDKVDAILHPVALRLGIQTYSIDGRVRYCDVCWLVKPDRTHHCKVCKACIMKMDHHCPWINNCVSYFNYKFFMLFLFYGMFYFGFILVKPLRVHL